MQLLLLLPLAAWAHAQVPDEDGATEVSAVALAPRCVVPALVLKTLHHFRIFSAIKLYRRVQRLLMFMKLNEISDH